MLDIERVRQSVCARVLAGWCLAKERERERDHKGMSLSSTAETVCKKLVLRQSTQNRQQQQQRRAAAIVLMMVFPVASAAASAAAFGIAPSVAPRISPKMQQRLFQHQRRWNNHNHNDPPLQYYFSYDSDRSPLRARIALASSSDDDDDRNDATVIPIPAAASKDVTASSSYGDVVSLKRPVVGNEVMASNHNNNAATAADLLFFSTPTEAELQNPVPRRVSNVDTVTVGGGNNIVDDVARAVEIRRRNALVAILSLATAAASFVWQYTHPIPPIALLVQMQSQSANLNVIGRNNKPTVVDFWAPWCENCKTMASTLHATELEYANRVNFVVLNGDIDFSDNTNINNAPPNKSGTNSINDNAAVRQAIQALRVDAIPHMAMIDADGYVETALIGPVPHKVLAANLDALLANANRPRTTDATTATAPPPEDAENSQQQELKQPLPYTMLDVFSGQSAAAHFVKFDE